MYQNKKLWLFIRYEILVVILLILGPIIVYHVSSAFHQNSKRHVSSEIQRVTRKSIKAYFGDYRSDVVLLAELSSLRQYVTNPTENNRLRAIRDMQAFGFAKKGLFDQVRYIDTEGMERIRLNLKQDGSVETVPTKQLQNKSDRFYYRNGKRLPPGEVCISKLDLNQENNQVELPPKPMIRFTTPVLTQTGDRKGMVILNYRANQLLNELQLYDGKELGELYLANKQGEFLKAPDPTMEWAIELSKKSGMLLRDWNPQLYTSIQEKPEGQIESMGSLISYSTIVPSLMTSEKNPESLDLPPDTWYLIHLIPREIFTRAAREDSAIVVLIAIISLIPLSLLAWFYANHRVHRQEKAKLEQEAEVLRVSQSLARGVAHEFRQPLAALQLASQMSAMTEFDAEKRLSYLDRIPNNVQRMDKLVGRLLKLTEVKEITYQGDLKILDLHFEEAVEELQ